MQNRWFWAAGIGLLLVALIGAFLGGGEEPQEQKKEAVSSDKSATSQPPKERFIPSRTGSARRTEDIFGAAASGTAKDSTESSRKEESKEEVSKEPKNKMVIKWKVPKKKRPTEPVWKPIKKEEPPKPKGIPEGGTIW